MSSILTLQQRINALKKLGEYLLSSNEELNHLIHSAHFHNAWFTYGETSRSVKAFGKALNEKDLNNWVNEDQFKRFTEPKKVGLVLAGNIPLVGFHDIISVLITGHIAMIKLSSQDKLLLPHLLSKLIQYEPSFANQIVYTERLEGFDAVIATGSNNSSRYFEYYFGKVPHIIRKNRNSIAVLSGKESTEKLHLLGHDIFDYFGLGCRNVSKLYVPEGYDFKTFFESIESYKSVLDHHKYNNNYDYNKSILLVNKDQHFDNGFLLLKPDERLASPLAVLHYEEYSIISELQTKIQALEENIQCIVSAESLNTTTQKVDFGESQQPRLWDYADGINTIEFLLGL